MRWYRAPEIVDGQHHYTTQIVVWSIGCVFGELLGSRPLCQGKDRVHQLVTIIDVTGTPTEEDLSALGLPAPQAFVRRQSPRPQLDLKEKYPEASPDALDLLRRMLTFHPQKRITVAEAMKHPYLAQLYDEEDERINVPRFALDETQHRTVAEMRRSIHQESLECHTRSQPSKQAGKSPQGQ